jgi:hypothetical protein
LIEVGVHHDHEHIVVGPLIVRQGFVKPADVKANTLVVDGRRVTLGREVTALVPLEAPIVR